MLQTHIRSTNDIIAPHCQRPRRTCHRICVLTLLCCLLLSLRSVCVCRLVPVAVLKAASAVADRRRAIKIQYGINPDSLMLDSDDYRHNSGAFASPPPNFAHPLVSTGEGMAYAAPHPHLTPRNVSFASFAPRLSYWYRSMQAKLTFLPSLAPDHLLHSSPTAASHSHSHSSHSSSLVQAAQAELQSLLAGGHSALSPDDQRTADMLKRV